MNQGLPAKKVSEDKKDANTCIAVGVGVGLLGAASSAITGAVCPLCIFIAPGLVGFGAYKKWKASVIKTKGEENE